MYQRAIRIVGLVTKEDCSRRLRSHRNGQRENMVPQHAEDNFTESLPSVNFPLRYASRAAGICRKMVDLTPEDQEKSINEAE
jgi:hypothetical protein